jgi:hypothetical protein
MAVLKLKNKLLGDGQCEAAFENPLILFSCSRGYSRHGCAATRPTYEQINCQHLESPGGNLKFYLYPAELEHSPILRNAYQRRQMIAQSDIQ